MSSELRFARRSVLGALLLLFAFVMVGAHPATAQPEAPPPQSERKSPFTHGVASGDVTPLSAVLWTRVAKAAKLTVEVSTDAAFRVLAFQRDVVVSQEHDFTAKVIAAPLQPGKRYYYRWIQRDADARSDVGRFTTAPMPRAAAHVRFGWSGDTDGVKIAGVPAFNDFEALDSAAAEQLDYFIYLGDTIYSDSPVLAPSAYATSLDEYRQLYKANRDYPALRNLLQSTSVYAVWDDHEVRNDYDVTVDPALYAAGRRAFREFMPILELPVPGPGCVGAPMLKIFRWGANVDLIVLDTHSCRSASAALACPLPPNPFLAADPVPTLPEGDDIRNELAASGLTTPSPSPSCVDAINDPSRTMLGPTQKALLKAALRESTARFKFVISPSTIAQTFALPYSRWEGYAAERREILEFIRDQRISHVMFLSTDDHRNLIAPVFIDRFEKDAPPVAIEVVTGPVAALTEAEGYRFFFGRGPLADAVIELNNRLLDEAGVICRNTDKYSYGVVEVESGGSVKITLKDDVGGIIAGEQAGQAPCELVLQAQ